MFEIEGESLNNRVVLDENFNNIDPIMLSSQRNTSEFIAHTEIRRKLESEGEAIG